MVHFAVRAPSTAARLLARPDIIMASTPHLLTPLACLRIARHWGLPFALEVRDVWPESLVKIGRLQPWNPLVWLFRQIEIRLYRDSDLIISLLPALREHLERSNVETAKLVWIPNGVDLEDTPPIAPRTSSGEFTIMYVGSHGVANALDSILDAAAVLSSQKVAARFRFIGDGPEKQNLRARAMREGLVNVRFEEPAPKLEVPRLLSQADILIVNLRNSDLYSHGVSLNKFFDYMAAARPVVAGMRAANSPIAAAQAGIVVPPDDGEALAEAILQLMKLEPHERAALGANGRHYVERHHSVKVLGERLETSLRQLVEVER